MSTIKISVPFKKQHFDILAAKQNLIIAGVDEVGRSCLCGPVVVAAAALKPRSMRRGKAPYFTDSKKMTPAEREAAYIWLVQNSWYATASVHHRTIDAVNIYQATLIAMRRAVIQLHISCPEPLAAILVDAMPLQDPGLWPTHAATAPQVESREAKDDSPWGNILYFNYGEERSTAIAAASVIAKVTRDRLMNSFNELFPGYQLHTHKGYGTPTHQDRLHLLGPTLIHRHSFSYKKQEKPPQETNLSLF